MKFNRDVLLLYAVTDRAWIGMQTLLEQIEDAFHAVRTAKSDSFMTVAVYDAHEDKQQEIQEMAYLCLRDYLDLNHFGKFASAH